MTRFNRNPRPLQYHINSTDRCWKSPQSLPRPLALTLARSPTASHSLSLLMTSLVTRSHVLPVDNTPHLLVLGFEPAPFGSLCVCMRERACALPPSGIVTQPTSSLTLSQTRWRSGTCTNRKGGWILATLAHVTFDSPEISSLWSTYLVVHFRWISFLEIL